MENRIHPTSIIHPAAQLGKNVSVGAYSIIEEDVSVGDGCSIGHHAVLHTGTRLGNECSVYTGAVLGGEPQDFKYKNEKTIVEIGDRTIIRECVTISRGTAATGMTKVGNECMLMAYSHVAHDCVVGDNVVLANAVNLAGHAHVDEYVVIGGLTGVHQFVKIGCHAMIGALFRVGKDVPPYILAGGFPLSYEKLNSVGLRRRGFDNKTITLIDETYRIIYRSKLNVSQAVQKISEMNGEIPEIKRIIDFIKESKRGIIPAKVK